MSACAQRSGNVDGDTADLPPAGRLGFSRADVGSVVDPLVDVLLDGSVAGVVEAVAPDFHLGVGVVVASLVALHRADPL